MKFSNPTQISIGMAGTFAGKKYRVVGRVVIGVVEAGRTYYWNEFNLESGKGDVATLVFEETQIGGEWRFFTMFEPRFAISAQDAATKRVGDLVNLDGDNCRVTRTDRSRVYYIEGKAPEGVINNSLAHYFNARTGSKMIVVSWTGNEVENYRGMNLTSGMVASAFNLQKAALLKFKLSGGKSYLKANVLLAAALILIIPLILIGVVLDATPVKRPTAVARFTAPSTPLAVGDAGTLNGAKYHITGHALAEVAEVGERIQRHEYDLTGEDGDSALLVHGMQPGAKDWVFLKPVHLATPLTPQQAAKVTTGQIVNVDGMLAVVTELFRSTTSRNDMSYGSSTKYAEVRYGFVGRQNSTYLLVRWNEAEISFLQGKVVAEPEILAAFGKTAGK